MIAPHLLWHNGEAIGPLQIALPGAHNRMNALAAMAAAFHVGVEPGVALEALARFAGVKRRLEVRGTVGGVTVIDDFAHHPTAIRETIAGLRSQAGCIADPGRAGTAFEHDEAGYGQGRAGREPGRRRTRLLLFGRNRLESRGDPGAARLRRATVRSELELLIEDMRVPHDPATTCWS